MSRTKRKPYTKSKRWDASCRNHGGCPYCLSNRMHKNDKRISKVMNQLKELDYGTRNIKPN